MVDTFSGKGDVVRVASLQPHFAIETPEDLKGDSERVIAAAQSRDRGGVRESTANETSRSGVDERTRETLRRLSHLIREKTARREAGSERGDEDGGNRGEPERGGEPARATGGSGAPVQIESVYVTKTERALGTYRYAIRAGDRDEVVGQFLKLAV